MRTTAATIDLGELPPDGSEEDTRASWPQWWRPDRWAGGRGPGRRWWSAAVVTVGVVLTTTAAAPTPAWATHQFTVPAGGYAVLTDHHLYLVDETDRAQGMSAYRLADGAPAWTLTHRTSDSWFSVRNGLPVEISMNVVTTGEYEWFSYVRDTAAFDPDSGQVRWTRPGSLTVPGAGGLGMLAHEQPSSDRPGWQNQLTTIDLATGRELWTTPTVANWAYPLYDSDQFRQLVTLTEDGELVSYDLATGSRLAAAHPAVERLEEVQLELIGSLVLLYGPERASVTAYDMTTLRPRWTAELPGDGLVLSPCGPVLCLLGGGVPQALDPATGALAWSADWVTEAALGDAWAVQPGPPWPPDLLLVEGWVVEAATGEPVLELREWAPLDGDGPRLGRPEWLLTRYEQRAGRDDQGRTWFARLRADPLRVEVLGAADGRLTGCVTAADHLACEHGDELEVWRLRQ